MTFEFSNHDQTITVHHYDQAGVYRGSNDVLIEANTGLPANSTITPLPKIDAEQAAIFDGEHWQVKPDNRGKTAYAKDRENDDNFIVADFSNIPDTHTLDVPNEYDSWTDSGWQYDAARYRPVWIAKEAEWQQAALSKINAEIAKYLQDQTIPESYSELRVTQYTEKQYYGLLMDRKLLDEYPEQSDYPDCGRPRLVSNVT